MNQPVEEGIITDAKKRYSAGVLKYKQMGYWQPDYVPKDSDVVGMLRITPQEGVDSEEYGNPMSEPGFGLVRQKIEGRQVRYTVHSYATDKAGGER